MWENIAGAKRYTHPRGFNIAGASAPVAPAVPTPLLLTRQSYTTDTASGAATGEVTLSARKRTGGLCLEMFNCFQAEQSIAIRKSKFLNKFSVINNVLCHISLSTLRNNLNRVSS